MADDVLSQAELEALLAARTSRAKAKPVAPARAPAPAQVPSVASGDAKPAPIATREQLSSLANLHTEFVRRLSAQLSAMLRTPVDVKLKSADSRAFGEVARGFECPGYVSVLRAPPFAGELVLDIAPTLLFPMIDRLLGGGGEPDPVDRRPLTDIELRLAGRVQALFVAELESAWRRLADVRLVVDRVESEPAAAIGLPGEAVVRLAFELVMKHGRGVVTLCLSGQTMRSMAEHLCPGPNVSKAAATSSSQVEVVVQLAETRIAPGDLANLHAGDIIDTGQRIDQPLIVSVDGVPKFHARPGTFEGRKAVQIERPLGETDQG
jgi:flagellar motor switch protein FliM